MGSALIVDDHVDAITFIGGFNELHRYLCGLGFGHGAPEHLGIIDNVRSDTFKPFDDLGQ